MKILVLVVGLLFNLYSPASVATDHIWNWVEIDLAQSLSLHKSGTARVFVHYEALKIKLYNPNKKGAYLLLCNKNGSKIICIDETNRRLSGYSRTHPKEHNILNLEDRLINGSTKTYVLYSGTNMILVSRYHAK